MSLEKMHRVCLDISECPCNSCNVFEFDCVFFENKIWLSKTLFYCFFSNIVCLLYACFKKILLINPQYAMKTVQMMKNDKTVPPHAIALCMTSIALNV